MIPWELSPGQPLGPNAWLPYVAQRDAPHMSGQEMALCAEDEITAMLGPRPPTVRAAEEITWKQEEDDLSPVLSPRQCKWFVSEEENLE
jgi:hypothetical protein